MTVVPALPPAAGPAPAKTRFFIEAAAAFEFMALWHSLPAPAQEELRAAVHSAAAQASAQTTNAGRVSPEAAPGGHPPPARGRANREEPK